MRVLIVGINFQPEMVGIGVYTSEMAKALVCQGHAVTVVTSPPHFPAWRVPDGYKWWRYSSARTKDGVNVIRCPLYVPKIPSGMRRILHYLSFALSSFPAALLNAIRSRPDMVFVVAPSLLSAPGARLVAWITGAKAWLHIQDFEVEAAMATSVLKDAGRRAGIARSFEGWVLGLFDKVSTISPAMVTRLCEKGVRKNRVYEFRNWSDTSHIKPLEFPSTYREELGIDARHIALYSGSIANKQGIEIIIEAAGLLKQRQDICFLICGDGPAVPGLRARTADLQLRNVFFLPLQPKEKLGDLLGLASLHLLPQIAGAADLVLPSKLTNMLASGRPVIATALPETGLGKEVEGCGLLVEPGDSAGLARAIERLADDDALRADLGHAAVRRCHERWDSTSILERFDAVLRDVVCNNIEAQSHSKEGIKVTSS
ncbi:WcaI family glycosyltransferase [Amaricoccus macauensis]|uniref:WcaI family glycosyltransferase n=1 Tax=Amaricoccus macauensis TaxID=57001 RepID=UPI003C7A8FA4